MLKTHSSPNLIKSVAQSLVKKPAKILCRALLATVFSSLVAGAAQAADLTVQVGAFGIAPNPDFTKQAGEYGEVLVLRGNDGITRVSIGRYDTKGAANAALSRLQLAGYNDAYVTNLRGRGANQEAPAVATAKPRPPAQSAPAVQPATATRTIVNPTTASSQRLPSGSQLVTPKRPAPAQNDDEATQAGRFRLRTHDTTSGQTSDVKLATDNGGAAKAPAAVVAGLGASDVPQHLRDKLVYLDGVPHIKDGDRFIPLTDAIDGK